MIMLTFIIISLIVAIFALLICMSSQAMEIDKLRKQIKQEEEQWRLTGRVLDQAMKKKEEDLKNREQILRERSDKMAQREGTVYLNLMKIISNHPDEYIAMIETLRKSKEKIEFLQKDELIKAHDLMKSWIEATPSDVELLQEKS